VTFFGERENSPPPLAIIARPEIIGKKDRTKKPAQGENKYSGIPFA
jgi:hypothetical protein